MVLGSVWPPIAFTAASTHCWPMPTGFWVMAPNIRPLLMASIWALPESYPTTLMAPSFLSSLTALMTPIAEPSFAPKKPVMSGLAWIIALARSVDLSWSPPPYCGPMIVMPGYLAFISLMKPSRRSIPVRLVWSWTTTPTLPFPPSASPSLSAAVAAALTLSVAAVVTGMSLSTPESNPMTGMFWSLNFWSSGVAALLSSAAKQTAAGCLSSSACSISICLSTWASVSGPSKLTVTPSSAAFPSAPFLTACQNWCWKPLDTIGMYFPAAALPGADAAGALAAPPADAAGADELPLFEQAAMSSAAAATTAPMRMRSEVILLLLDDSRNSN